MNEIEKMIDIISRKIMRGKSLTADENTFIRELSEKIDSIHFWVDEKEIFVYPDDDDDDDDEGHYELYGDEMASLHFKDGSTIDIHMCHTCSNAIIAAAVVALIGIDRLDVDSFDTEYIDFEWTISILLEYPDKLIEFIDWSIWVCHEDIDVYNLLETCVKRNCGETTMALLRYLRQEYGDEAETTTTIRL